MPHSFFSVVQYVPDQFADERVNVGIVVISPETGFSLGRFPESEKRARRLTPGVKLDALDDLRKELQTRLPTRGYQRKLGLVKELTVDELWAMHRERGNTLQITAPKPSSADPEELAERLVATYLPPLPQRHRARGTKAVRGAIKKAINGVGLHEHLREEFTAEGQHDTYTFPFALENGTVRHVIEALSFDRLDKEAIREDVYATAYRFEDLRRAHFRAPLNLVVGSAGDGLLTTARRILRDIEDTMVVEESALPRWARRVGRELGAPLAGPRSPSSATPVSGR